MTKKVLISPAFEEGRFNGLVDGGEYLRQSSLYKQILPRPVRRSFSEGGTPSRTKTSVLSVISLAKNLFNQRNPRLINDLRLRKITYEIIKLFLQNEPNFRKSQVNVTVFITRNYVQMDTWSIGKNEPKTNPNEPKTNPILAKKMIKRTQTKPISMLKMLNCVIYSTNNSTGRLTLLEIAFRMACELVKNNKVWRYLRPKLYDKSLFK